MKSFAVHSGTLTLLAALALWGSGVRVSLAADHSEAPLVTVDQPADIADLYAWHDNTTDKLVTVLTFAGLASPTAAGSFDADVLYTVNIDNDGDNQVDIGILVQFFQDNDGNTGMRVENLPGAPDSFNAPVERTVDVGACRVFSGQRDDPFFFDVEGFRQTLQTGALSFDSSRDGFAGTNATVIVLEMDLTAARGGSSTMNLWATSARR